MPNRIYFAIILVLLAVTFLVYYDSFNNSFVYDDFHFLVDNPAIKNLNLKNVPSYFTDRDTVSSQKNLSQDVWRPLVTLSFALDYKAWKLEPRFYHIENTALHAIDAILVYILLFLILGSNPAAFIGALIFAIHPIQTGAVTWISGRSNVLFLLFFLSAMICHLKNRAGRPRTIYYCASLVLFVCALLSKEMAITLPVVMILYDLYFYSRKWTKEYIGYYLPFFLTTFAYLAARFSVLGVVAQQAHWWGGNIVSNVLMTLKALAGYVKLLIIPTNLRTEYFMEIPKGIGDRDVLASLLILSLVAIFCWIYRRKKMILFWALWFFITLIPVCNIVPFKAVMAERFLYLPLIGFAAIVGIFLSEAENDPKVSGPVKALLIVAFSALLISYGALSISRNTEWRDELSLYTCDALRSPGSATAHYNLGYIYARKADAFAAVDRSQAAAYYAAAIEEFNRTVVLKPDSQIAYFGLGNAYSAVGQYDLAVKNFNKAAMVRQSAEVYNNLALVYYKQKMYGEAIIFSKKALKMDPRYVNAWINLSNAYLMEGKSDKAAAALKVAAKLQEAGH